MHTRILWLLVAAAVSANAYVSGKEVALLAPLDFHHSIGYTYPFLIDLWQNNTNTIYYDEIPIGDLPIGLIPEVEENARLDLVVTADKTVVGDPRLFKLWDATICWGSLANLNKWMNNTNNSVLCNNDTTLQKVNVVVNGLEVLQQQCLSVLDAACSVTCNATASYVINSTSCTSVSVSKLIALFSNYSTNFTYDSAAGEYLYFMYDLRWLVVNDTGGGGINNVTRTGAAMFDVVPVYVPIPVLASGLSTAAILALSIPAGILALICIAHISRTPEDPTAGYGVVSS